MRTITVAYKPYNLHNLTDVIYTGRNEQFGSFAPEVFFFFFSGGGKKTRVHYVRLVSLVRVGR